MKNLNLRHRVVVRNSLVVLCANFAHWVSGVGVTPSHAAVRRPWNVRGAISRLPPVARSMHWTGWFRCRHRPKSITLDGGGAFASIRAPGYGVIINVTTAPLQRHVAQSLHSDCRYRPGAVSGWWYDHRYAARENADPQLHGASSSPAVNIAPGAALDLLVQDRDRKLRRLARNFADGAGVRQPARISTCVSRSPTAARHWQPPVLQPASACLIRRCWMTTPSAVAPPPAR